MLQVNSMFVLQSSKCRICTPDILTWYTVLQNGQSQSGSVSTHGPWAALEGSKGAAVPSILPPPAASSCQDDNACALLLLSILMRRDRIFV